MEEISPNSNNLHYTQLPRKERHQAALNPHWPKALVPTAYAKPTLVEVKVGPYPDNKEHL
ncbi:hypothetical protein [Bowmanella dokdonensis]|uniref:Uncharacterized protein n=1 Tax=Bowmanella dokdonensis TaxID=751969 RepID=A0A939DRQ8_9ALTE|nr:hypothetical protein [Bowmanella dokdonensis]MBN7827544.1 hypothetical protein [Bowmanella dokdonensis]